MQEKQIYKKKNHRREVGQSLVEFALSGLLLSLLFSGMVDFGRLYFTYVALEDSAGEGALYLSLYPSCVGPSAGCADPNNAIWRAKNAVGQPGSGFTLDWGSVSPEFPFYPANPSVGDTVTVRLRYDYTIVTPLIQAVFNLSGTNTIELTVEAQQIIVSEG